MDSNLLAELFERDRPRLRAVAYRMLGSIPEADDAVQEAWLRLSHSDADAVRNLSGWLTTVVARVSLDMLRSRRARAEQPLDGERPADPIVQLDAAADPEHEALLADSVGIALLVVLDTLSPAERLAFVLHDTFGVSFEEIAAVLDRSPAAARQLASRARRRVRGAAAAVRPEPDLARQRAVVDAFLAAAREGDFDALVAVLDPDVEFRVDTGAVRGPVHGSDAVARQVMARGARLARFARPAIVNGQAGTVVVVGDTPRAVTAFSITREGRIAAIEVFADPARLRRLNLG